MPVPARLVLVAALAVASFAVPAQANDCSNPKQTCGGCTVNRDISTADPRPVICYV